MPRTDTPRVPMSLGGAAGIIEVSRDTFAADPADPMAQLQPPAELTWRDALLEPTFTYRNGAMQRLSRETTLVHIALLEAHRDELVSGKPQLEDQLVDVTRLHEANLARLAARWVAVCAVVADAQRRDAQIVDMSAKPVASPPMPIQMLDASMWLATRRQTLSETQEFLAYADLRRRMYDDPRASECRTNRQKSTLEVQIGQVARAIDEANTKIFELGENLRIVAEEDMRADPQSAWSIRRRQRINDLEEQVRSGRITAYQIVN